MTRHKILAFAALLFLGPAAFANIYGAIRGVVRPWPSPFDEAVVVEQRGRAVCVLASGDPFFYGVGAVLARHVDPDETLVVPGVSAFSLAAARLG